MIRGRFITIIVLLAMAALFLLPTLYNGFPFVFFDSYGYLGAIEGSIGAGAMRTPYYALFNRLVDLHVSPWPGIVLQALITAWVVWLFSSTLFLISGPIRFLLLAAFLTLATSLPWFVGWIMPDIFTPLMIIALALLCFAQDVISPTRRGVLVLLIAMAVAVHQANLPVALWTFPALALCALLGWRLSKAFLRGLLAGTIGLALGIAALLAMNLHSGRFGLSHGGPVFLLARFLEDGTALSYLERVCPQRRFAVCAQLDELKSYRSLHPDSLSEYFLWRGPLEKLDGFGAEEAEAHAIVVGTLSEYPVAQLGAAVENAWRLLLLFPTGAELTTYADEDLPSRGIRDTFGPAIYETYRHSKQIRGILPFGWINRIHMVTVIISVCFLIVLLAAKTDKQNRSRLHVTIFVAVLVIGNAATLGVLSGPYPRYQSRVIWLVPLLAGCFLLGPRQRN